jgi:integrase
LAEIKPDIRASTHNVYRQTLRPISEEIGDVLLGELNPLMLTEAFTRIRDRGKGARQLNLCYGYLKTCLKQAVQLDVLPSNPMEKVRRPKWTPRTRTYWRMDQVEAFIKTGLQATRYWDPLFVFLCVTGLRISEAIALHWSDIDFEKRSVSVVRAIVWQGSTRAYDVVPPKTKSGKRDVSLPKAGIVALRIVGSRSVETPDSLVFQTKNGTPPKTSDLRKYLLSLCQRAGVPTINVHGLRHVAAMLALEAVNDPYLVQKRLGHSHVSVTLGIYGYSRKDESEVRSQMDKLLEFGADS